MAGSHNSVYGIERRPTRPLIADYSLLGGIFRWLRWVIALCMVVLLIDLVCVLAIWDDRAETLADVIAAERQILGLDSNTSAGRFVYASVAATHDWLFVKTGLERWLASQRSGLLAAIVDGLCVLVETALLVLQLFAMRIAVLILSLPLFVAVGASAVADGMYGWLMRRTRGGREPGFIYHRAKRAVPIFMLLVPA